MPRVITVVLVIYLLLDGMLKWGALYRFAHLLDGVDAWCGCLPAGNIVVSRIRSPALAIGILFGLKCC
ncbi:MAG: hypothetical protein R3C12_16855 [Planctomycetaceae bacterium]